MRFYDEHAEHRERFEIVALCVDHDGDLKSLEELDRQLQSVVEHVWNGQQLPFPVLLDSSFRTCQSFGVRGVGHTILIDPTGKLVEGDTDTLAMAIDKQRE
jgi:hypothetical protein